MPKKAPKDWRAKVADIRAKQARARELVDALERSLAMEELWPEAFDQGQLAGCHIEAPPGTINNPRPEKIRLTVKRADGEKRTFPLSDADRVLWPDDIRRAVESRERQASKQRERRLRYFPVAPPELVRE